MKKSMLFGLVGAFCFMLTSCGMMHGGDHKKDDDHKHSKKPSESHRRYHSRSTVDFK